MPWQDWVFFIGGMLVLVGLVPTIRGAQKPALTTSIMTFGLVAIFAVTMASMGLWLSALTNAAISLAWGILALQRHRQDAPDHRQTTLTEIREELMELPAGSEGS